MPYDVRVSTLRSSPAHGPIIVVMGVSGSGKSTVARLLAEKLSCSMLEGDDLHSAENIRRMESGKALDDADRSPWLLAIAQHIASASRDGRSLVVSCSALKRRYRDVLRQGDPRLILVFLAGDPRLIGQRMSRRQDHFMPNTLLDSQFADLESPGPDEHAIRCDIAENPRDIVESVIGTLMEQGILPAKTAS
jgi:gluconokinase